VLHPAVLEIDLLWRNAVRSFALLVAVTTAAASPVLAEDLVFTLINDSAVNVTEMYVAKHSSDEWGESILTDGTVDAGTEAEVTIADGETTCDYDMRFVGDNGATHEVNQNLCELASYTLND
jgi:hypothetical protein